MGFGEMYENKGVSRVVKTIPDPEDLTAIKKIHTKEDLLQWVKDTGRKSIAAFEEETGVEKSTLIGLWTQTYDEKKPEGKLKTIGKKHIFAVAFSRVFDEWPEVYKDEKGNFFTLTRVFG